MRQCMTTLAIDEFCRDLQPEAHTTDMTIYTNETYLYLSIYVLQAKKGKRSTNKCTYIASAITKLQLTRAHHV